MNMRAIPCFFLILAALHCTQQAPEAPAPEQGSESVNGGFVARLVLTRDPRGFLDGWDPASDPETVSVGTQENSVRRGNGIAALAFFGGCEANESGQAQVTAEFRVMTPDGNLHTHIDATQAWTETPPPPDRMERARATLGIMIKPQDPLGEYAVHLQLCDQVTGTCRDRQATFQVIHRLQRFDLDALMQNYYLDPRPDWLEPAMQEAAQRILDKKSAQDPMIGFFAEAFSSSPDARAACEGWAKEQPESVRSAFQKAISCAASPREKLGEWPISPSLNDLFWGAFFASGDTWYLERIFEHAKYASDRDDMNLFLTGASAKWSLARHLRHHRVVRMFVDAALEQVDPSSKEILEEILNEDPDSIKKAMQDVLKAQRDAGVW